MSWEDLHRILCDECREYTALLELLDREQCALRRMDRCVLQEIHESKERILEIMAAHGRERMAHLKTLTGVEDPSNAVERFRRLSDPRAAAAQTVFVELQMLGARVKDLVAQNHALTARGLSLVQGALQVVADSLGGKVYGALGQWSSPPTGLAVNLRG